jgi:DNA-binding HxlR family transcriptional regulator
MGTPPPALEWSVDNCTVERALRIIGDRWTMVVLREVFNGIRRFDDMRVRTSIPRQVLTDRLSRLVAGGLLRREPYREAGSRERLEYRLTDKGLDIYPALVALNEWGTRYHADPEGSPLRFAHRDCGADVRLTLVCAEGHEVDDARDVLPRPGPGARRRLSAGAAQA